MFAKLSVKNKLRAACAGMIVLSVAGGAMSHAFLTKVLGDLTHLTHQTVPNLQDLAVLAKNARDARAHILISAVEGISDEDSRIRITWSENAVRDFEAAAKRYTDGDWLEGEKEAWVKVENDWRAYRAMVNEAIALAKSADPDKRRKIGALVITGGVATTNALNASLDTLAGFHARDVKLLSEQALKDEELANLWSFVAIVSSAVFGLGVGYLISASLTRQLSALVERLRAEAGALVHHAEAVTSGSQSLSSASQNQASAIQQTAASCDEVSAMVAKNAESAQASLTLSKASLETANKGKDAVREMAEALGEISASNEQVLRQVEASNGEIGGIVAVIAEIGSKTKVINDIVFQTKLLSFNASVEAARAGEHGKGFSVVAQEVGNLAQMSGNAAKEIAAMLDESIRKVDTIVAGTRERVQSLIGQGRAKMSEGTRVAQRCDAVLDEIVAKVSRLDALVGEISAASREQAQGVGEITKAMTQLDATVNQNATSALESARTAVELSQQTGTMRDIIHSLEVAVHGHAVATPPASAPRAATRVSPAPRHADARASQKPPSPSPARAAVTTRAAAPGKVVPLAPPRATMPDSPSPRAAMADLSSLGSHVPLRKAAGDDLDGIPSENDPRFEDV